MNRGHIYLIDHEPARRGSLAETLAARRYRLQAFENAPSFLQGVEYERVPHRTCVLTYLDLTPITGVELVDVFRADQVTLPIVLIGAFSELQLAVKAMRYSGTYILWRPFTASLLDEVVATVLREWNDAPRAAANDVEHAALRRSVSLRSPAASARCSATSSRATAIAQSPPAWASASKR
jgi:two-component system response regulator FixJ